MAEKIVLIVTFFGELPFYYPAFQWSCKFNPDIKWLIFSDCHPPQNCPENIEFVNITVDGFCDLASQKLGFHVRLSSDFLYKLCDFKPSFGVIYEDYIRDYDFWGHCDVDIIWGDIRSFINSSLLETYQIISSRPKRISGHFCLYRNQKDVNTVFLSMPKTVEGLKNYKSYAFLDEDYFSLYLQWLYNPTFLSRIKQAIVGKPFIPIVYWDQVLTTSGKHQRQLYDNIDSTLLWEAGQTFHLDGTEMMYLHFHELKNTLHEIDFSYEDTPQKIQISTTAITSQ